MAASAAPLSAPAADPLAGLDSYYLRFLPTHLADANRAADLFKLLLLQRGDNSNAWFGAKPDVAAYLADVTQARALAVKQADCAKVISFGLIADSVRSITQLRAPVIETLVNRDLLSLQQAISMCAAAEPEQQISGQARLLGKMELPQRGRYLAEILTTMGVPVTRKSGIGKISNDPRLPLSVAEHVAVISRLAALPALSQGELAAIERAAWLVSEDFAAVEAAVSVAEVLAGEWRARVLDRAWSAAAGLDLFRGRPEAAALVAACAARGGDERYLADAVDLALSVLNSSDQRLRFNWSRHQDDPGFGRSRLMRLQLFTEPLKLLAPVLGAGQMSGIVRELTRRWDVSARFGLIALLPRVAQLGLLQEAGRLFGQLDDVAVMAAGALLAAGVPVGDLRAVSFLRSLAGLTEMEPRTLCLLALLPDLPPDRRLAEIADLLRGVEDLGPRSSFRADVLKALEPAIRQLPDDLRAGLIRRARQPGELTRSAEEADTLLDPLVDVWPAELLRHRLETTRRIGLWASQITSAHRAIQVPVPARPEPGLSPQVAVPARPEPGLSPGEAAVALEFVAGLGDADKAAALVLLAPFLDAAGRHEASTIADGITAAHLRLEPSVRLAALEPQLGLDQLVKLFRLLGDVTGGLGRLKPTIDLLAALIEPGHASALRAVLAELAQDLPKDDLIVLCPVAARLGEPAYYHQVDQTIDRLAVWFGLDGTPVGKPSTELASLTLDAQAAAARLIGEFSRRGEWAIVRSLLTVLWAAAAGNEAKVAAAESEIINGQAGGSAAERLALLAELVRAAPTRPRRLRALAAALRAAQALPQSELSAELAAEPDIAPGSIRELDPDLAAAVVAMIDLQLARDDLTVAAAALNALVTARAPYRMAMGRLASHAAGSIARYLDEGGKPAAQEGESAIGAYMNFVAAHPEDYTLQEAAGGLLRGRLGAAAADGREIRPSWLSQLSSLADADEPGEVLLHQMALEATCDAGGAAAKAGRAGPAVELFGQAFDRWQRHRELETCTRYFATAAHAAASVLREAGKRGAAARIAELATATGAAADSPGG